MCVTSRMLGVFCSFAENTVRFVIQLSKKRIKNKTLHSIFISNYSKILITTPLNMEEPHWLFLDQQRI